MIGPGNLRAASSAITLASAFSLCSSPSTKMALVYWNPESKNIPSSRVGSIWRQYVSKSRSYDTTAGSYSTRTGVESKGVRWELKGVAVCLSGLKARSARRVTNAGR